MILINKLIYKTKPFINTFLFTGWSIHEYNMICNYNIYDHNIFESVFNSLTLTWQYVGLFIISHDLHHNKNPNLYENFLGRISLFSYGGFFLNDFSKNHRLHHENPGVVNIDPDFSDKNIILWYLNFMKNYISLRQIGIEMSIYFFAQLNNINIDNLILFWIMPVLLSSIQLFYYGTYLVHNENGIIENTKLPKILNTITCYNFGNHSTHHEFPQLEWFEL